MVAIKHFGMPSCCDNCDMFEWTDKSCIITYTRCENPFDDKNDDCPLIEIEPQEISDRNLKMWKDIFEAESEDKG